MKQKIFIGSDHAGFELKKNLLKLIPNLLKNYEFEDVGCFDTNSVDYPDFADKVTYKIKDTNQFGILICGSGQGMSMRANKFPWMRASLVYNDEIAKLSREHNDANVICIGSRFCTEAEALKWIEIFLTTPFAGGRHAQRVEKISAAIK